MSCCRPELGWLRAVLWLLLCLAASEAAAAGADGQDARVEAHLRRGQQLFAEGKYPESVAELQAGYAVSAQPRFLYAIGQAYRLNHQCTEATRAYRDFLRSQPSRAQVAATEQQLARCAQEQPVTVAPAVPPTASPVPVEVAPPVPISGGTVQPAQADVVAPRSTVVLAQPALEHAPSRASQPLYKKWWLWTTLGAVAVVGLGVGLGLGLHPASSPFDATLPSIGPGLSSMALGQGR